MRVCGTDRAAAVDEREVSSVKIARSRFPLVNCVTPEPREARLGKFRRECQ